MIVFAPLIALGVAAGVTLAPATSSTTVSLGDVNRQTCALVLHNATKKPVQIWWAGFWPNHRMSMWDSHGKPVALTAGGKGGRERFGSQARDKNSPWAVQAGKSYRYATPSLVAAFKLRIGEYTLSVLYEDASFGKPLRLACDKIKVKVVE